MDWDLVRSALHRILQAERRAERMGPDEVGEIESWVREQLLNRSAAGCRCTVVLRAAGR